MAIYSFPSNHTHYECSGKVLVFHVYVSFSVGEYILNLNWPASTQSSQVSSASRTSKLLRLSALVALFSLATSSRLRVRPPSFLPPIALPGTRPDWLSHWVRARRAEIWPCVRRSKSATRCVKLSLVRLMHSLISALERFNCFSTCWKNGAQ